MSRSPLLPDPQRSQWSKFIASFVYAFSGLWYALRTQRNVRVHVVIACLAVVMGIVLRISAVEFAMIFVAILSCHVEGILNVNVHPLPSALFSAQIVPL